MNRRKFLSRLMAGSALPALSGPIALISPQAMAKSSAVPSNARFWAEYLGALHQRCTPEMMQSALSLPASQVKQMLPSLIRDHLLTSPDHPNRLPKPVHTGQTIERPEEQSDKSVDSPDLKAATPN